MEFSIKKILAVGSISLLIFAALGFVYCYTKAGELESTVNTISASLGSSNSSMPPTVLLAVAEGYLWVSMGSFTSLGNAINTAFSALQGLTAGTQYAGLANTIIAQLQAAFPSTMFYYLIAIVSGFAAGMLLLRHDAGQMVNGAIAPLVPAIAITAFFAVTNMLIASQVSGSIPGGLIPTSLAGVGDYLMVFVVAYVFVAMGTMLAALLGKVTAKDAVPAPEIVA
jgi:hypothetical protein